MAHAQKPDFDFRRNGRVRSNQRGASVQSTTGSRGVRISGSNAGYAVFRGSVKGTGYPLHMPVSPSLPLPCVTVCHHISAGVYTKPYILTITKLPKYFSFLRGTSRCDWSMIRTRNKTELYIYHERAKIVPCSTPHLTATSWIILPKSNQLGYLNAWQNIYWV